MFHELEYFHKVRRTLICLLNDLTLTRKDNLADLY